MKKTIGQQGKKLSAKEMKALKGGLTLSGCAGNGLLVIFNNCQSNANCPDLNIFCCGNKVMGQCEEGICSYGPTRCTRFGF
jgi:hypothetical protein